jgi:NADH-quinone oxidoreductase subunit N
MNMGAFMVVILVSKQIERINQPNQLNPLTGEDINDYNGLGARMPYVGVIMAIFLFSLIGLPPLAGFIGKLYIFGEVINQQWYILALIGVLNGVVSLYYYARVIKAMFLTQSAISNQQSAIATPVYPTILLTILALPIVVIGLGFYGPLLDIINKALGM